MKQSLYNDYKKFEKIMRNYDGSNVLDTSDEYFLPVTTVIPLLCEIEKRNIPFIKTHKNTKEYVRRILNMKKTSSTTLFVKLPFSYRTI